MVNSFFVFKKLMASSMDKQAFKEVVDNPNWFREKGKEKCIIGASIVVLFVGLSYIVAVYAINIFNPYVTVTGPSTLYRVETNNSTEDITHVRLEYYWQGKEQKVNRLQGTLMPNQTLYYTILAESKDGGEMKARLNVPVEFAACLSLLPMDDSVGGFDNAMQQVQSQTSSCDSEDSNSASSNNFQTLVMHKGTAMAFLVLSSSLLDDTPTEPLEGGFKFELELMFEAEYSPVMADSSKKSQVFTYTAVALGLVVLGCMCALPLFVQGRKLRKEAKKLIQHQQSEEQQQQQQLSVAAEEGRDLHNNPKQLEIIVL